MRNLSLGQFYKRINKKILFTGGYTEDKDLPYIIKACRLKPISIFGDNFKLSTTFEPVWIDEFNNILEIKKKKAKLKLKAVSIEQTTTDLYKNSSYKFIANHSISALVGLEEGGENFILLFKCCDNYFRCYYFTNGLLMNVSPLIVGLKVLKQFVNEKIKNFHQLPVKSELKELHKVKWFVCSLPAPILFLTHINNYKTLRNILHNA